MKVKIELDDIRELIDLGLKFPLYELYYDNYKHCIVFHTKLAGHYTEFFSVEVEKE